MKKLFAAIGLLISALTVTNGQSGVPVFGWRTCAGVIYSGKDVGVRAQVKVFTPLTIPKEAAGQNVSGTVVISAVLCRDGRVTDIEVVKGLPFGITESAIKSVMNTTFAPAMLNAQVVSQRMQFEFSVNESVSGLTPISPSAAAGRLIEEIDIIGNRQFSKDDVLAWIKSRPGEPYSAEQVEADLKAILRTGYFDKSSTRVILEDAARGGVRVSFELLELPIVKEIVFEKNARGEQSGILYEFARRKVDLEIGQPLDPAVLKKATSVIEDYFRSQGWINVKAQAVIENLTFTEVRIVFKFTGTNF